MCFTCLLGFWVVNSKTKHLCEGEMPGLSLGMVVFLVILAGVVSFLLKYAFMNLRGNFKKRPKNMGQKKMKRLLTSSFYEDTLASSPRLLYKVPLIWTTITWCIRWSSGFPPLSNWPKGHHLADLYVIGWTCYLAWLVFILWSPAKFLLIIYKS